MEELRRRWEEKEEVVSGQPESQKEQLTLQQVGYDLSTNHNRPLTGLVDPNPLKVQCVAVSSQTDSAEMECNIYEYKFII